jgi:hypothetical protein
LSQHSAEIGSERTCGTAVRPAAFTAAAHRTSRKQPQLPSGLDDIAEASHENLALAILIACHSTFSRTIRRGIVPRDVEIHEAVVAG